MPDSWWSKLSRHSFELLIAIVIALSAAANTEIPLGDQTVHQAATPAPPGARSTVWNGQEFFTVWVDRRLSIYGTLFGARISAAGEVLDPLGISLGDLHAEAPQVAWNGNGYVVIDWATKELYGNSTTVNSWLLDRNGRPLRAPISLGDDLLAPRLANNARGEVMLAGEYFIKGNRTSFVMPVAPDGTLRREQQLTPLDMFDPVAVSDGDDWVIFGTKLCSGCPTPTLLNSFRLSPAHQPSVYRASLLDAVFDFAAAAGGDRFLLAWTTAYPKHLAYAVVDAAGNVLFQSAPLDGDVGRPSVSWDGKQFVIAWTHVFEDETREYRSVRIARDGQVLDGAPLVFARPGTPYSPPPLFSVTSSPSKQLLLWGDIRATEAQPAGAAILEAATVDSFDGIAGGAAGTMVNGAALPQSVFTTAGDDGILALLAEGDDIYLHNGADDRLRAQVIPFNGAPSKPAVLPESGHWYPTAAWGGGVYLAAWVEYTSPAYTAGGGFRIHAMRIDRNGQPLDSTPLVIAEAASASYPILGHAIIGIAWDGAHFLVAWISPADGQVYTRRVGADGALIDSPQWISPTPPLYAQRGSLRVFPTSEGMYVCWYENATPSVFSEAPQDVPRYVRGTRVNRDGVTDYSVAILAHTAPGRLTRDSGFHAAWNGSELMMTWAVRDERWKPATNCAYAQRFTLDGTSLGEAVLLACGETRPFNTTLDLDPFVAWTGREWFIAAPNLTPDGRLRGYRLDTSGKVIDTIELAPPGLFALTTAALQTKGGLFISYQRFDPASGWVKRAYLLHLAPPAGRSRAIAH